MQTLSGSIDHRLVAVADNASWLNLDLVDCVVVGGPHVRHRSFFNVTFVNCVFLYDGMEVSGSEWLAFMSMERMPHRSIRRETRLD